LYAFVFGLAYLLVAILEITLGDVSPAGIVLIEFTLLQNSVHWITGSVVFGSFIRGENAARFVAKGVAIIFGILSILGLVARAWLGGILGFPGPLPWFYNWVHIATAAAAAVTGFAQWAQYTLPDVRR
jgi:hypothetical protein